MPRPLAAASLCAALLALLLIGVIAGVSQPIDELLMTAAFADSVRGPLSFLRPLTELGSTGVVTVIAVAMLPVGFAVRRIVQGAAAGLTIALASVANTLVKLSVARERPDLVEPVVAAGGYSFPSGHAALSMVAYGIVGVLIARSSLPAAVRVVTIAVLAIVVLGVGVSRVYLGVHYPTDVAAGWAAGGIVVAGFAWWTARAARAEAAAEVLEEDARGSPPEHEPSGAGQPR